MRFRDFGKTGNDIMDRWLDQVLQFSQHRVSILENLDVMFHLVEFQTAATEQEINHNLGRIPLGFIEIGYFPYGTSSISWTKEATNTKMYLKRDKAGQCVLLLF